MQQSAPAHRLGSLGGLRGSGVLQRAFKFLAHLLHVWHSISIRNANAFHEFDNNHVADQGPEIKWINSIAKGRYSGYLGPEYIALLAVLLLQEIDTCTHVQFIG